MSRDRAGQHKPWKLMLSPWSVLKSLPKKLLALPQRQPQPQEWDRSLNLAPIRDPSELEKTILAKLTLPTSWQSWAVLTTLASSSAAAIALLVLLRLPALPRCSATFWPMASASLRLYCAQVAANQQTLDELLKAIALVNHLPRNHPLRSDINRWVEKWSLQLLELGEQVFQQGKLPQAMEIAQKVPTSTRAYSQVPARIAHWRSTWAQAETIYQKAETALQQQNWRHAFTQAVRLLAVDNRYWQTRQYEALNRRIMTAQADERELAKARSLARSGRLNNLIAAMKLAEAIDPNSYFRKSAQAFMAEVARSMLDLAAINLANQDLQAAITIAEQIPETVSLAQEAQDFIELAHAESWTWSDSTLSFSEAITSAQKLSPERPLYPKAQQLIARWQSEIEALQ
ncbi:MAG TPA: hypothetical protein V6D03_02745, partial [Candidatus Caenarcaniphilales bacterium]